MSHAKGPEHLAVDERDQVHAAENLADPGGKDQGWDENAVGRTCPRRQSTSICAARRRSHHQRTRFACRSTLSFYPEFVRGVTESAIRGRLTISGALQCLWISANALFSFCSLVHTSLFDDWQQQMRRMLRVVVDGVASRDGWFVVPESAAVVWVHVESRVVRAGNRHADAMAGIEDQAG